MYVGLYFYRKVIMKENSANLKKQTENKWPVVLKLCLPNVFKILF